jgi:hypothetical protein
MSAREQHSAAAVLMIRPRRFGANAQTAGSNFFQGTPAGATDPSGDAEREFDALAAALERAGVRVIVVPGCRTHVLPDEVFPNNWVSFHADGTVVLYPMLAPNRRLERRRDVLDALQTEHGFRIERIVDLTRLEEREQYLEGTGSLVLDRVRRVAYACLSPRTHPAALAEFGRELGYETVAFRAVDRQSRAIYHTNVAMALGSRFAAVCMAAVSRESAAELRARFERDGRELIDLTFVQLEAFAGNMLELNGQRGPVVALSSAALRALAGSARRALERYAELVASDVSTVERIGGGSVRCMLCEVALPSNA